MKSAISRAAVRKGLKPKDFSANVWTGIREYVKKNHELYGQKYKGSAIRGGSQGYADHFTQLIKEKAEFLGITVERMEKALRNGDQTLLSFVLASPLGYKIYQDYMADEEKKI